MHKYDQYKQILKEQMEKYDKLSKSSIRKIEEVGIMIAALIAAIIATVFVCFTRNVFVSIVSGIILSIVFCVWFWKKSIKINESKRKPNEEQKKEMQAIRDSSSGLFRYLVDESIHGQSYSLEYSNLVRKQVGIDFLELSIESSSKLLYLNSLADPDLKISDVFKYDIGNGVCRPVDDILVEGLDNFTKHIEDFREREFLVKEYEEKALNLTKEEYVSKMDYYSKTIFSDSRNEIATRMANDNKMFTYYCICETIILKAIKSRLQIH